MDALLQAALEARRKAHAPYSHFLVGAALEDDTGRIDNGPNVASRILPQTTNHQEVLETSRAVRATFVRLLTALLPRLA